MIRDGLRILLARDRAVETWLQREVVAACDALLKKNAARTISTDGLRAKLAAEHRNARTKLK